MFFPVLLLVLAGAVPGALAELEQERPNLPPGRPAAGDPFARTPGLTVAFGSYVSVQVNVDAAGNNIVGDAANEPSIAVNPLNPSNMVVGWRQFDTITSDFRQAGWAYTSDGGQSWTFPGALTPGTFRSDPVLDVNALGTFFYQSLTRLDGGGYRVDVFRSFDGGVSWSDPVYAFGGDKNWMAVDRSGGPGDGFVYGVWQRFFACCGPNIFTRSTDGGGSFQTPVPVVYSPLFGTSTVGPSGEVYVSGVEGTTVQNPSQYVVAKSLNASDHLASPAFSVARVNLGGGMRGALGPNPVGMLGQANVLVNPAPGSRFGEVYLIGSVGPVNGDPLQVHVTRSEFGGAYWYPPVRINDDPGANWQWMAAAAIAPNGRIDVIWHDTRLNSETNLSQLYYAYSWDGGQTWSPNVAVTPAFDTSLGYPMQDKMGDYSGLVSDATGAHAAYTATLNGEQDVFYVRLFPDCNGNGVSDVTDVAGPSMDCDANHVPDECQTAPACLGAGAVPHLSVGRSESGDLTLQWNASCGTGDDDYAVYEGTLPSFGSHAARACTTGGQTSHVLTPSEGDTYYLIVPRHADREGSYGAGSAGAERPPAAAACMPQHVRACGP